MNLKSLLDEAMEKGEKIKSEIFSEVLKSKTIQQFVSNKNFLKALAKVIQTKEEIKKVIQTQVKSIFHVMDVPRRDELINIASKIGNIEKVVDKIGRNSIAVKMLTRDKKEVKKAVTKKTTAVKKPALAKAKVTKKKSS